MKVLFVSLFSSSEMKNSNNNVYRQAHSLKYDQNIDVEILTNPYIDNWHTPKPCTSFYKNNLIYKKELNGIVYNLISPNVDFDANNICSNVLDNKTWGKAVNYGKELLKLIKPDILHLQHRHSLWWLIESAQLLGIKTIYTAHDWGIACQRSILIKGDGTLCNGIININKCSNCILSGRSKIGRINEKLAMNIFGRLLLKILFISPFKNFLVKKHIIKIPVTERVNLNLLRLNKIFESINFIIVPQKWGIDFFSQFNIDKNKIIKLNWFSKPKIYKNVVKNKNLIFTYVGRVSEEKNIETLLNSLLYLKTDQKIIIKITGNSNENLYSKSLQLKYGNIINNHSIEWINWINTEEIYNTSDCILIMTGCMENGPLTMYEAFSYKKPVIAANIPTISEFVEEGINGYLYDIFSPESLSNKILMFIKNHDNIKYRFPIISSISNYTKTLSLLYNNILDE
jgi:glycosyltransferase involved in cell wall biosynthesis